MSMIWPIALVVFSNVVYQICAKSVPNDMDAMASIVQSAFLAVVLLFVGALLYHESISISKIVGVGFCLVGLFFLNR